MKKIHSLSFKVPFMVGIIILLSIVMLSIIIIMSVSKSIKESTFGGFENTVQGYASMVDMVLHEQVALIDTYDKDSYITQFILDSDNPQLKEQTLRQLSEYNKVNFYAINIGIADINGNILMDSVNPNLVGISISSENTSLFNKLKANNYNYQFDDKVTKSLTTGGNALLLVSGLQDFNGNVIGILYINLDIKKITEEFIKPIELEGSENLSIINHNRFVMMSSDENLLGKQMGMVYDVINREKSGIINAYSTEGSDTLRSCVFRNTKMTSWTVVLGKDDTEIYAPIYSIVLIITITSVIFIIIASILVSLYVRSIAIPLRKIVTISKNIADGDLTNTKKTIIRKDEIGELADSFATMRQELFDIIIRVRDSVEKITNSAQELSQGSNDLSHRTESQAASLEETASSMEQMASTIKSSTDQSVQGNKMMVESRQSIESAGDIILETTRNIEEVYEASTKIKDITNIIENIAFQTNILALNAAVEAARAGDQGKGFAVVASEVRNLAQTTQSSVKDITNLVDNAYDKINKATDSARTSQEIFNDLRVKIDETARIMQDISSTAVEQQTGVDQVNRAVADMDSVTQQNAALVEESYAATMSLSNQAQELYEAMKFFKIDKDEE